MATGDGDYQLLAQESDQYHFGTRTRTAAFLAWTLATVWRIDPEEVEDAICDGSGDKGIDAVLVDDANKEIVVFQSKYRVSERPTQGDADLRQFRGVAAYFDGARGIDGLLAAGPNEELRALIQRLRLRELVASGDFTTRLVFVTNGVADASATGYIDASRHSAPALDLWDRPALAAVARRAQRPRLLPERVEIASSVPPLQSDLAAGARMVVGLISAGELVKLPGIADLSLFALNVRLGVGRTRINRELGAAVGEQSDHAFFPAYHNGLTLLTDSYAVDSDRISLDGISVVNGCQSLLALYEHRDELTSDLSVLVKIIELGDNDGLADQITFRANNQNPVSIRDQRSTDVVQRALQAEMHEKYGSKLFYAIREGQAPTAPEVLDNRVAAQLITAIWLKEPWAAVRKVKLFDQEYHRVFAHGINADKLYLANLVNRAIEERRGELRPELQSSFASVRFTIAYLVAAIARMTDLGAALFEDPGRWLPDLEVEVRSELDSLAHDVVESVNFYVEFQADDSEGEFFDPKVVFKSQAGVRPLERDALRDAERATRRDMSYGFGVQPV